MGHDTNEQTGCLTRSSTETIVTGVALLLGIIAIGVSILLFTQASAARQRTSMAYERAVMAAEKSRLLAEETRAMAEADRKRAEALAVELRTNAR